MGLSVVPDWTPIERRAPRTSSMSGTPGHAGSKSWTQPPAIARRASAAA